MNSKRSYLDSLNAGRPRRQRTSLDELNRTLETLETRFDANRYQPPLRDEGDEITRRMQRLAGQADRSRTIPASPQRMAPASARQHAERPFDSLARDIERARIQEEGMAAVGRIAGELKDLHEELRHQMTAGLRHEFDVLRKDIERAYAAAAAGAHSAELGPELERLSSAIHALAGRGDDNSVNMLRLEMEQVKSALDTLAREETIQSAGRRWDEFDPRLNASAQRREAPDPAINGLNARLEQINDAVNGLPESLSLRSLEEKVRTLAGVVDQFSQHQMRGAPEAFELIGERLDEISRAIVASSLGAPAASFERIEARITSLARQIEELADDRPVRALMDGLAQLSQRVDEVSRRTDMPEKTVKKLAQQIAAIAEKLDTGHSADADRMLQGFEDRFADLSAMLEQRQNDASEQGQTLFRDLERRLEDLAERLDRRSETPPPSDLALIDAIEARFTALSSRLDMPGDSEAIRSLEARLEDISSRLDQSARHPTGIDPDLIRNLEAQVAGLSEHLSRPGNPLPDFEDIGPRLDSLEQSIAQNRDSILSTARQAAEEAIRGFSDPASDEAAAALAGDLKSLEMLARRSDERNTKTFEAIHDTLLKIVERLGSLETRQTERRERALPEARFDEVSQTKLALDHAPSMDPDGFEPSLDDDGGFDRSPSEAAAAAALAAISSDVGEETARQTKKRSMLGGLTRAFSARGETQPVALAGSEETVGNLALAPEIDLDEPLDPKAANRPLEPGSGAPDLNAIMKRVRDDRAHAPRPGGSEAAKSDFIAAARRAAQAAAAEAEILKRQADKKSAGSAKFSLGGLFHGKRKSLLMASGAVLLAFSGLQLGKAYLGDGDAAPVDTAAMEEPVIESAALENEAAEPAAEPAPEIPAAQPTARSVELAATAAPAGAPSVEPAEVAATAPEEIVSAAEPDAPASEETASEAPADEAVPEIIPPAAPAARIEIPAEAGPVALREAAAGGDAKALFQIGARYAEAPAGDNLPEAAKWYQRSADLGFAPAQYRIGSFYEKGLGVARDVAKAKTWYQLAAGQGNASAMHNLAVLFAMGADGAPDNDSAARWFLEAAEFGVTDSQFNLGILTAKGVGVPQDLGESYKWFALVAKTGDKDAAAKRDEVANAMSAEQLEKARATAELWRPKPVLPEANGVDIPASWKDGEETTAGVDVEQAVKNIQTILAKNGYDVGGADGVMGAKTKSAIVAFQKDIGMDATGEVNQELVQALLEKR